MRTGPLQMGVELCAPVSPAAATVSARTWRIRLSFRSGPAPPDVGNRQARRRLPPSPLCTLEPARSRTHHRPTTERPAHNKKDGQPKGCPSSSRPRRGGRTLSRPEGRRPPPAGRGGHRHPEGCRPPLQGGESLPPPKGRPRPPPPCRGGGREVYPPAAGPFGPAAPGSADPPKRTSIPGMGGSQGVGVLGRRSGPAPPLVRTGDRLRREALTIAGPDSLQTWHLLWARRPGTQACA